MKPARHQPLLAVALLAITAALLPGCNSEPVGGPLALTVEANDPVKTLQLINENGQRCWIKSGGRDFAELRLMPELDTRVGRPRLLVLSRKSMQGLPQLVIEAAGSPVKIETYGPLASTGAGAQINADIMRWSAGAKDCKA
ncbi:hypothetical protein [Nitratireductor sp. CH_MIT9313-5]|uniref:hypothetical protein n=1 Tax=Nitratireductor sp. CH_MIT9313-5 TaxID=3107764 RepID=UPI00300B242C